MTGRKLPECDGRSVTWFGDRPQRYAASAAGFPPPRADVQFDGCADRTVRLSMGRLGPPVKEDR